MSSRHLGAVDTFGGPSAAAIDFAEPQCMDRVTFSGWLVSRGLTASVCAPSTLQYAEVLHRDGLHLLLSS